MEVVLFHHVQGLTDGVRAFADEIRHAGHTVHTPDLFDGRICASIPEGLAYAEELGFPDAILERGVSAVEGLPGGLVYGGFSMGCMPAQRLAQTRPGARGALLFYSFIPTKYIAPWPEGLPAQIHGMDADPYFAGEGDLEAARELVASTPGVDLFVYEGDQHHFADSSLPSYRPEAASLLTERVLRFLADLDRG